MPAGRAAQLAQDDNALAGREGSRALLGGLARGRRWPTRCRVALAHINRVENKQQAYEDILWALVNTKEFLFNH